MTADDTSNTSQLRKLAPAAAEWPSWWRRNLTPGALYTVGAVVLAAVVTVTTVVVTNRSESRQLEALAKEVAEMRGDVRDVKHDVGELERWKEHREELAEQLSNPYVKSRPHLEQRKAAAQ